MAEKANKDTQSTKGKTHVIKFEKEKETKNAVRFNEVVGEGEPTKIGQLYVQKHALTPGVTSLTVTVAEDAA